MNATTAKEKFDIFDYNGDMDYLKVVAVENRIDDIYGDFESRVCEKCKYCTKLKDYIICDNEENTQEIYNYESMQITLEFGCNKWEPKNATD